MKASHLVPLLPLVLLSLSCGSKPLPMSDELKALGARFGLPLARVSLEKGPVWLEFAQEGPALVSAPLEASLVPWEAWPDARRAVGFLPFDGIPVAAINRWGFLSLVRDSAHGLYLLGSPGDHMVSRYTIASFARWDNQPSILLYRDSFYRDSEEPVPVHRFYSLPEGAVREEPALLSGFAPGEGWEINSLAMTHGGGLVARALRQDRGEVAFAEAGKLSAQAAPSNLATWLGAQEPRTLVQAQGLSRDFLLAVSRTLSAREILVCTLADLSSPLATPWALSSAPSVRDASLLAYEDMEVVKACAWVEEDRAILLREDGRWLMLSDGVRSGLLPALPAGFVWTGIALAPDSTPDVIAASAGKAETIALASWEEIDEWEVGAAGLCISSLD